MLLKNSDLDQSAAGCITSGIGGEDQGDEGTAGDAGKMPALFKRDQGGVFDPAVCGAIGMANRMSAPVLLHLCQGCGSFDLTDLRRSIDAAFSPEQVRIVAQSCMNGCANPVSMGLQSAGRATCFFAGVNPKTDVDDIVSTLCAYLDARQGWIEDARSCGRLRFCLVGRVPAP